MSASDDELDKLLNDADLTDKMEEDNVAPITEEYTAPISEVADDTSVSTREVSIDLSATGRKRRKDYGQPRTQPPAARMSGEEEWSLKDKPCWKYIRPFLPIPAGPGGFLHGGPVWHKSLEDSVIDAEYVRRTKKDFDRSVEGDADPVLYKAMVTWARVPPSKDTPLSADTDAPLTRTLIRELSYMYINWYGAFIKSTAKILWKSVYKYRRIVNGEIEYVEDVHFDLHSDEQMKKILASYKFTRWMPDDKKKPSIFEPYKLWLEHENRRDYEDIEYIPIPVDPSDYERCNLFNLYEPGAYLQKDYSREDSKAAYARCSAFFEHVREIWCNGDEFLYMWTRQLLAFYFQKPHIRPDMAVVLHGKQGSGKTVIVTVDTERFNNKFNVIFDCKLVAFWDESEITKTSTIDKFKSRITSGTVNIEGKFKDTKLRPNYLRWFIATNNELKVLVTPDNRRCLFLETSDALVGKRGSSELKTYINEILNIDPRDLAICLSNINIDCFSPSSAPKTPLEIKWGQANLSSVQQFWMHSIKQGRVGPEEYWLQQNDDQVTNPRNLFGKVIKKDSVYASYKYTCGMFKETAVPNNEFWKQTKAAITDSSYEDTVRVIDGKKDVPVVIIVDHQALLKERMAKALNYNGLFDEATPMSLVSNIFTVSTLDIKRYTIPGLIPKSSDADSPLEKQQPSNPDRSFHREDYDNDICMSLFTPIMEVTESAGYAISSGCILDLSTASDGPTSGFILSPTGGVEATFTFKPKGPMYKEFDASISGDEVLYVGPVGCKRFTIVPKPGKFLLYR
ncbi:hypothetical protein PROFUN_15404 [Planoprotostelium fungivorum]|uniref:NrS-1 polymerase-like helicase domain-containing protein n=1 Tax=Planoprotostelium fungivorum TaxID=1890364 RepID=A0A2P6MVM2_9EUKA|nr:hypothetical protein PROFUN_15404 [Planoprotostelium fungivorum]